LGVITSPTFFSIKDDLYRKYSTSPLNPCNQLTIWNKPLGYSSMTWFAQGGRSVFPAAATLLQQAAAYKSMQPQGSAIGDRGRTKDRRMKV